MTPSVGIILLATDQYAKWIEPRIAEIRRFMFPGHTVKIFLHTDSTQQYLVDSQIYLEHKPWPLITLQRFDTFLAHQAAYDTDYLFYMDIDVEMIDAVRADVLSDFVVTQHHWFAAYPEKHTFETRPESTAYVAPDRMGAYVAGGFFGGKRDRFLTVARQLKTNIDADSAKDIVAIWHDESHLNRYVSDNPDVKLLSPEYCYFVKCPKTYSNPKILAYDNDDKGFNKFEGAICR